jgi:ADP-ribose pyrophosphatase YjhB (NUDIX family)
MNKVISAGGIVVRNNPNKQILLTIFTHIKGLSFAKGHVEKGETYEQTAIREVTEETGLTQLSIVKKLGVFSRLGSEVDGTIVNKDIHMFLMKSDRPDFHQQAEEKYGWFELEEAISQMATKEDREFLEKIKNEI